MTTYTLRYALEGSASSSSSSTITTYSLVELPAALAAAAKSIASSSKDASSSSADNNILSKLVIKGQPNDDAVLCTDDTTYTMRSVQNSNSLLLCRPRAAGAGAGKDNGKGKGKKRATTDHLNIESTLHQTLELDLCVPRLEKIGELLRGQEWSLEVNEEERQEQLEHGSEQQQHPLKKVRLSPSGYA